MKRTDLQRLNIAMLGHKKVPGREGGVEIVVEELGIRMVKKGHNVTCYNRKGHHVSGKKFDTPSQNEYNGTKLKYVFTVNKKGLSAMTSSFAGALRCAFGNYDIVHFHAEGPCAMMWLPKLFGKHCIATIHGLDWQRAKWGGFASKYIKSGEKAAVKYADEIIVLSRGVQEYFFKEYSRKTEFVPNGVNKPSCAEADLIIRKWNLTKDSYILFLGRLVPEKGIAYLIKAFKNVSADKKLVIAGGSSDTLEYKKELEQLSQDDERIIFTDFVCGRELEELYSNAYIYVLPSDLEGMPLSLLEAMSYGNCCVTSDIAECAEVVEDKAVTFPRGNADELANTLQSLCDNPQKVQKYKNEAQNFILGKYNWDDVVEKTLDLYKNILTENKNNGKKRFEYSA